MDKKWDNTRNEYVGGYVPSVNMGEKGKGYASKAPASSAAGRSTQEPQLGLFEI